MSENCIIDINFRAVNSKIKIDDERQEHSLTANLGKFQWINKEDSVFLINFELGEVRFSISEEDMRNLMKNIGELLKNS